MENKNQMVTNILIEGYQHMPSYELTVLGFKRLGAVLPIKIRPILTKDITPSDIAWCDILIDVRGANPLSAYVVKEAVNAGRKVYLSLDDDLLENTKNGYADDLIKLSLLSILNLSSCMITSSHYLGMKYKEKYGKNYVVIDTIVDEQQFKSSEKNHKYYTSLLYAASPMHKNFFEELISPILNRLYDQYGESISLSIVGPDINTNNVRMKVSKYASMPFEKYKLFMNEHMFDIGLAPLFDNEFCKSKYFNKYLEYSTNGICGVYSNVMPYTSVINNGENGLLVDNDPNMWYKAIIKLIDDVDLRNSIVLNARTHILKEFSLESVAEKLKEELPDMLTYKARILDSDVCKHMQLRYIYYAIKRRIISLKNRILNLCLAK